VLHGLKNGRSTTMLKYLIAVGIFTAPLSPALGDQCQSWHATTTDSSGNTLVCTHTPDSGHLMYWEREVMDR
jgi:hypothetical protein